MFIFHVPVVVLVIVIALLNLKESGAVPAGQKFDFPGAILYGASMIALMYGFSDLPTTSGIVLSMLGCCRPGSFFPIRKEAGPSAVQRQTVFYQPVFFYSCMAALIMYSSTFSITFLMSLYLQNIKGFYPAVCRLCPDLAASDDDALFSAGLGRMSDRHEPRIIATSGMGLTAFGLASLAMLNPQTSTVFVVLALVIIGFGFALFSSPNANAVVVSSVEKKHLGAASGTIATMRVVGQMFSMGIVTLVFALMLGQVQISPETHGQLLDSINASFIVTSLLCLAGVYFSLKRGNLRA